MSDQKTERKNVYFPGDLIYRIKKVSEDLNTDFSKFVREAAEERLQKIEKDTLEKKLAVGYKAKAKLNKKICEDFKYVDGENS